MGNSNYKLAYDVLCGLDMRTLLTDKVWQVFLSNFSFTAKFIYLGSPILGRVTHRLDVPRVDCLRMDACKSSSRNRKRALRKFFRRRFLYFFYFDNSTAREKKKTLQPFKLAVNKSPQFLFNSPPYARKLKANTKNSEAAGNTSFTL